TAADRVTRIEQDVLSVLRHWGQSGEFPVLTRFEAREEYDLDALARELSDVGIRQLDERLRAEYADESRLWRFLYPQYEGFRKQVQTSQAQYVDSLHSGSQPALVTFTSQAVTEDDEVPTDVKRAVKKRDGSMCLCCGSTARLQVDHIQPRYLGGSHDPENLQTLCGVCNRLKGTQPLDFRSSKAPKGAASLSVDLSRIGDVTDLQALERLVRRVVNVHYGCAAVKEVVIGQRGPMAREWEITLVRGHKVTELRPKLEELRKRINEKRNDLRRLSVDAIRVVN
ncbi:HNH endonuclease, partial [Deinococcus saxicola]